MVAPGSAACSTTMPPTLCVIRRDQAAGSGPTLLLLVKLNQQKYMHSHGHRRRVAMLHLAETASSTMLPASLRPRPISSLRATSCCARSWAGVLWPRLHSLRPLRLYILVATVCTRAHSVCECQDRFVFMLKIKPCLFFLA